jgi:hypothetical protein
MPIQNFGLAGRLTKLGRGGQELYNASKFGYNFKVIRGYLFETANMFTDYVDFFNN